MLLGDPRVADAVVVRRRDARWGEVPVALVVLKDQTAQISGVRAIQASQS